MGQGRGDLLTEPLRSSVGAGELPVATRPVVVIQPSQGWAALNLRDLWEYRDLLYYMLWREVKGRYRQMALGPLWAILQPLVTIVVFSLLFGVIAKLPSDGLPYPVFAYSALLPWNFFSSGATRASGSLVQSAGLITKVYFPRLVVPIAGVLSGLVEFVISFVILVVLMLYVGRFPTPMVIFIPAYLLLAAAAGLAIGLWLAALTVRFRDVSHMVAFLLQFWMYATPVVYSSSVIPEQWRLLYHLNPMTAVIEGFRWALLGVGEGPGWSSVASSAIVLAALVSGAYFFRRTERNIVDLV